MLITYFDEVKYQKGRQPYYWLAGLVVSEPVLKAFEQRVNDLAEEVFKVRTLSVDTEFHAADILSGNKCFQSWELEFRIKLIKRLVDILGSVKRDDVGKIYVRMDVSKMLSTDYENMAFMYLLEKVDDYLRVRKESGILIGDREGETIRGKFSEQLSLYRAEGTPYHFGKKLQWLVDTVHFTNSHHSRMLQLADFHVWLRQLRANPNPRWHQRQVYRSRKFNQRLLVR